MATTKPSACWMQTPQGGLSTTKTMQSTRTINWFSLLGLLMLRWSTLRVPKMSFPLNDFPWQNENLPLQMHSLVNLHFAVFIRGSACKCFQMTHTIKKKEYEIERESLTDSRMARNNTAWLVWLFVSKKARFTYMGQLWPHVCWLNSVVCEVPRYFLVSSWT